MPPWCPTLGSPGSWTTARTPRPMTLCRPPFWSWSWSRASRCRRCWPGRDAWGWSGAWTLSAKRPSLLGRPMAAHEARLVHRDIKPANLLIRPDGVVKVTDFGVAQALGQDPYEQDDAITGTAGYLAPEQAVGQRATPASDIYALGVVAYECLAGRRPFTSDHPIAVALAHLLQPPPPLPDDVPAAVRALVARAMAKEPNRRPGDASLFGRQLHTLRKGLNTPELDATDVVGVASDRRGGQPAGSISKPRSTRRPPPPADKTPMAVGRHEG